MMGRTTGVLRLVLMGLVLAATTLPQPVSARPDVGDATGSAGSQFIAAVPGSRSATYATSVVVIQPGDELTFVNAEPFPHDVRSVAIGPDHVSWCDPWDPDEPRHRKRNPRQFPIGKCPLLWSLPISMTNGAVQTKVYGTENLESGTTVDFYCTVFPNMRGKVIVL